MALKMSITADEWNGLDEGVKGLYGEKGGAYELQLENPPAPPAPADDAAAGLKSALEKERTKAKELEKQLKSLGKTPEEIKADLEALQKIQDASKTEAERLRDAAARAEKEKAELAERVAEMEASAKAREAEALRLKVAIGKGLRPELADRLRGETEEELRKDADMMSAFFAPANPAPGAENPPAPQAGPSIGSPANPPAPKPGESYADQIAEGKKIAKELNDRNKQNSGLRHYY
jgi:chromosome segregation ATPase